MPGAGGASSAVRGPESSSQCRCAHLGPFPPLTLPTRPLRQHFGNTVSESHVIARVIGRSTDSLSACKTGSRALARCAAHRLHPARPTGPCGLRGAVRLPLEGDRPVAPVAPVSALDPSAGPRARGRDRGTHTEPDRRREASSAGPYGRHTGKEDARHVEGRGQALPRSREARPLRRVVGGAAHWWDSAR